MSILIFFLEKNKTFKQKKVYQVNRHTMGYLWTKYLKLRFLGLVPLVTRSVEKVALKYEPIALEQYQKYMSSINKKVKLLKSGLVTSMDAPYLGASPDAKVIDPGCSDPFGLSEY